ncbi:hypothetical protein [Psychrobacter sp. SMN/5/1215-MNA-CIBAN-0208]
MDNFFVWLTEPKDALDDDILSVDDTVGSKLEALLLVTLYFYNLLYTNK